jgi:hypothetical protein
MTEPIAAQDILFTYNDGGRADAGFKGSTNDCVARAIAIAAQMPYADAYALVNDSAKDERPRNGRSRSSARTGVNKRTTRKILAELGAEWVPTMQIGSGCRVHLRSNELPAGRIIVKLSRHVAAVIDRTLHDTHDCHRGGTRCVYGYWKMP